MQFSRHLASHLGAATLALLSLAIASPRAAHAQTLTTTLVPTITPAVGGGFLFTYLATNSPTSTEGISEFDLTVSTSADLMAITQPTGFLALYTTGDFYISFLSTDVSVDIAPGASGTFSFTSASPAGMQSYLLRNLDTLDSQGGQTLAPADLPPTPEPSPLAAFAAGALSLAALTGLARCRRPDPTEISSGH